MSDYFYVLSRKTSMSGKIPDIVVDAVTKLNYRLVIEKTDQQVILGLGENVEVKIHIFRNMRSVRINFLSSSSPTPIAFISRWLETYLRHYVAFMVNGRIHSTENHSVCDGCPEKYQDFKDYVEAMKLSETEKTNITQIYNKLFFSSTV